MIAKNFKLEHVEKIFELYDCYVGPSNIDIVVSPREVLEDIQRKNLSQGYRAGSRWNPNSKLEFNIHWNSENVTLGFNPNFDPKIRNTKKHQEAVSAGKLFQEKFTEYLAGQE